MAGKVDLREELAVGRHALDSGRVAQVAELVRNLADPIKRFFESTMVMADQPEVRYARLSLLKATAQQLLAAGDFTRLVIDG